MDPYIFLLIGFGALVLLTAWLPMVLSEAPLSLPISCVAIGAAVFALPLNVSIPHPANHLPIVERLTELVIIISLMGAALKIDRKIGWRSWMMTWRLLAIAMPITIFALAWLGHTMLGLGAATALVLGASLAPTDPVLASDVQVGPPKSGQEDDTRFALTSEAGLNDGLAFPFIMCAIAIAEAGRTGDPWVLRWLGVEVVWRLAVGVGIGVLLGFALGWLVFRMPNRAKLSRTGDGFVALGITVAVYGIAEALHGYGFVSVFVSGLALRAAERNHKYHQTLHDFSEQLERLLMMILLVLFGGAITSGGLLDALTWSSVGYALLAIFIVRPLAGWFCLAGTACPSTERAVISFFGIRGLGSIYYLAYALQKETFHKVDVVWSTTAFIILISIVLHGVSVTPVMRLIDRRQRRGIAAKETKTIIKQQRKTELG
ncbi:sodium:proton antiporter [Bradyrhizobium sp. JYMT SZCCT0180]|uniref:cation:proton antiporter n=1 Tax=Bradyrhizobium sp. JYMT SZCCT0180 TaxID=2807666 RepID=UPI001BAC64F7|nr:sodium:proton antiporter [Bradyrhizobium sp. JYMT SZCCT0180]MBR1216164.1 sodium:proton antiporter [Bradyrhizobium sp. JYMT SZCCT0180]